MSIRCSPKACGSGVSDSLLRLPLAASAVRLAPRHAANRPYPRHGAKCAKFLVARSSTRRRQARSAAPVTATSWRLVGPAGDPRRERNVTSTAQAEWKGQPCLPLVRPFVLRLPPSPSPASMPRVPATTTSAPATCKPALASRGQPSGVWSDAVSFRLRVALARTRLAGWPRTLKPGSQVVQRRARQSRP